MASTKAATLFRRLDELELTLCLRCNRISHNGAVEKLFALISRLGDGIFWYTLMLTAAILDRADGGPAALHMLGTGLLGLLIYKALKQRTVRQRPSITWSQIRRGTAPLDLYSFPSGHTLHAVAFTLVALHYYPGLAWLLVPMTLLIALSRVVLGLHYPTDVIAGAAIGATIAVTSVAIIT